MSEALTRAQYIRAELFALTGYDTAAAQKAVDYVADDELKFDLFKRLWSKGTTGGTVIGQVEVVIQKVKEALILFPEAKATK